MSRSSASTARANPRSLRIIAGVEHAEEGTVALTRGMNVTYLPQEAKLDAPHGIMTRNAARLSHR